jgi:hypothetical protein
MREERGDYPKPKKIKVKPADGKERIPPRRLPP